MNILQLEETISYEHRGVIIYLHLDYENEKVSLVEKNGTPKKWEFTKRTREYLGGWWVILEAMQKATEYGDQRLRDQAEARKKIKTDKQFKLMVALSDIKPERVDKR